MSEELLKAMAQSIIDGESEIAADLARQSIEAGMDPLESITKGYVVGVRQVGETFACGEVFLP
jgi:methanogenic corrinoid protein MtbC1